MAQWRNGGSAYGIIAQALHWLVAALVLAQTGIGLYAASLPVSIARLQWLSRHKSLGLAVLVLVLARLAWRWLDPPPALPEAMPRRERRAALAAHRLLYALLVAAPLAGWAHASAAGLSVNWFGLFLVPDIAPRSEALAQAFKAAHGICVAALALLVAVHVAAALRHALVLRDGVMRRMLPW
ncbi:MAG: cytochrome b/b6 domain-containing protein [Burkholderiales bacterium]|nr:cytochrome b/b6 domain-containing protein [Burkholderiales bacterium]